MKRTVEVNVGELYSLIHSAEDFGFSEVVPDFIQMLNLKDVDVEREIEEYAQWFLTGEAEKQGYTDEDYENAIEYLTEKLIK